jgi:N-acetylglucosaminyl-diphospho-decaprenol L-rhamnosyltransferase
MLPSATLTGAMPVPLKPGVSICVVAWNDADNLARCLSAIPAAGAGCDLQVIVVDNGSRDHTDQVLRSYPSAHVIRNAENRGLTRGRNQALTLVQCNVVLMLDADTIPLPGSVRRLAGYLKAHPRVGLVAPKLLNRDGSLQLSCRTVSPLLLPFLRRPPLDRWWENSSLVGRHLMRDFDHSSPLPVDWVIGAAQCYRATLLPLLGVYDEHIFSHGGEDTDWCLRIWKAGYEVHYLPEAEVVHCYGHYTRKHLLSKQSRRALTDYYYTLWKHRDVRGGIQRS